MPTAPGPGRQRLAPAHSRGGAPLHPTRAEAPPRGGSAGAPPPSLRAHRREPASVKDCRAHAEGPLTHCRGLTVCSGRSHLCRRRQDLKPVAGTLARATILLPCSHQALLAEPGAGQPHGRLTDVYFHQSGLKWLVGLPNGLRS